MMKPEDVRKDFILMCAVRLIDRILLDGGLDLGLVTYNVLPTSGDSGLIEFVDDSKNLHAIGGAASILAEMAFLKSGMQAAADRFTRSLAGFWIVSFLCGVRDRHTENVMFSKDGEIFQVDFGFILGCKPPQQTGGAAVPIAQSLLEVMDQAQFAEYRKLFITHCVDAYRLLRPHYNLFATLFGSIQACDPPVYRGGPQGDPSWIYAHLRATWCPGFRDSEAENFIRAELNSAATHANMAEVTRQFGRAARGAVSAVTRFFGGG
jgi:hypothetical protein